MRVIRLSAGTKEKEKEGGQKERGSEHEYERQEKGMQNTQMKTEHSRQGQIDKAKLHEIPRSSNRCGMKAKEKEEHEEQDNNK